MEINLSCRDCPETSVDTIHSSIHRDSEFELQTEFTLECVEKERKWGEGWKGEFLVLSLLSDLLTHQTWLTPIPQPLDISFLPRALRIIFSDISQDERSRRKKRTLTVHHGFCGSLIYLFYTLHSSTGLSIDLTRLCSALCARGVGGWVAVSHCTTRTVNFNNSHIISMTEAFSVFESTHTCSKCKSFPNHFHSCGRKTVKVLTRGEKSIWGWAQDKIACSNRYVSLSRPNSPCCIPRTVSGKEWLITWHLNFAQLSFTSLCTEQVLRLEGLKLPALFQPFSSVWNEKFLQ